MLFILSDHRDGPAFAGHLPVFGHVTDGKVGDVKVAQKLDFPRGSIVVIDRGYTDYRLFTRWTREGVFFVCRLKANADIVRVQFRSHFTHVYRGVNYGGHLHAEPRETRTRFILASGVEDELWAIWENIADDNPDAATRVPSNSTDKSLQDRRCFLVTTKYAYSEGGSPWPDN
jgi:hypothetical protein